ncbi:MAG: translesion error-prone DNA polymerase V autoproteolytic subunit [Desulfobulbaceae bacterium]|nr:translesion error-prone DNA polymerase V autoproteolytic subunit [Desulfobulbaceae bacterium]
MELKTDASIAEIYGFSRKTKIVRPLFLCGVSAGFPSPADDYIDRLLDLNELLIKNPPATFFVKVAGDSMTGAGIYDGGILIVDRSIEATNGRIVIAAVNGELTVKRLIKSNDSCRLVAENANYEPLEITEESQCEIWGVVTGVIHQFEK